MAIYDVFWTWTSYLIHHYTYKYMLRFPVIQTSYLLHDFTYKYILCRNRLYIWCRCYDSTIRALKTRVAEHRGAIFRTWHILLRDFSSFDMMLLHLKLQTCIILPDWTFVFLTVNEFDTKKSNVIIILFNIEQLLCQQSSEPK